MLITKSCTPEFTEERLNKYSLSLLKELAEYLSYYGYDLHVNSAFRSPEYERSKGRTGEGAHTTGEAFDVRCVDNRQRYLILLFLLGKDVTRIGISKSFIHFDTSSNLPNERIWLY